jgi:ABC-type lipoprotein release transport system permease subunit
MYFTLSWRNIWRNKKRTIIAAASVFFAVVLAIVMRSAQIGSYAYMIDSSAKLYTGYLQIQGEGYWENRSLDKSINPSEKDYKYMRSTKHVTSVTPRLEGFALVSDDSATKVAQVIGTNPAMEDKMTGLKNKLVKGNYLDQNTDGALVANGLAQMLKLEIGDSLVLYGQGYHGQIAAAIYPVIGFVKMPFQQMNNGMVFLNLKTARQFYSAPNRVTSVAIMIENQKYLDQTITHLKKLNHYAIMRWDEMLPDLVQSIRLDNASGIIMLIILYIVISFGVFGTVMMMVSERYKEFGILISVGMRKWRLMIITTIESILVAFTGVIFGILGSIPLVYYLHLNPIHITGEGAQTFDALGIEPIFNFSTDPNLVASQALVVLIIALITAIYPALFIRKLKPVEALHG